MTQKQQKPDLDELLQGDFIDCASPESFLDESNSLTEKVLYAAHARLEYMTPPLYSPHQIFCGCRNSDHVTPQGVQYLQTPEGEYHLPSFLKSRGLESPHVFIANVDATLKNLPRGLSELNSYKVMILGDTHHLERPLQNVLDYFLRENYDLYISDCLYNHAHFYKALKPNANIAFFPGFRTRFEAKTFNPNKKLVVNFVGKLDPLIHPFRNEFLSKLTEEPFQKVFEGGLQAQASAIYSNSLISLNFTLNNEFNMRVMEVIAAGGFLLTDKISDQTRLSECFEEGVHYISFESYNDCREKINYFLCNPGEAISIAQAAYEKYKNNFSIAERRKKFWFFARNHNFQLAQATSITDEHIKLDNLQIIKGYEYLQTLNRLGYHEVFVNGDLKEDLINLSLDLLRLVFIKDQNLGVAINDHWELSFDVKTGNFLTMIKARRKNI